MVIHPPIDFEKFRRASERKKRENRIVIGTLIRFNVRKIVPNIIRALNILKEEFGLDFVYYLAGGDGVEYEKKRILEELKQAKFPYKYFGEISERKKIEEFYPSLDIFVLPPLDLPNDVEGFGIVYLEANAYGIPVVASKTGGVSDAVKEGVSGVFADPTSPRDIADKIIEVLKDREKYAKSAKDWARKFDVNVTVNKLIRLYINHNLW